MADAGRFRHRDRAVRSHDDGRIDLADSVYVLRYLFKFDKQPPVPFPDLGTDDAGRTPDDRLTCDGGSRCL